MDFPSRLGEKQDLKDIPNFLLDAITSAARPHTVYKSRDLMLVYEDEQVIYDIDPDFSLLKKFDDFIIVTAKSKDSKYDINQLFDENLTNLFRGVVETTNEAIANSILKAETTIGFNGNTRHAIPLDKIIAIIGHCSSVVGVVSLALQPFVYCDGAQSLFKLSTLEVD